MALEPLLLPREAVLVYSCLRNRRVVGDASGGKGSGLGSNLLQTRGAQGLGPRSGSLQPGCAGCEKYESQSPGLGLPEECLCNKYFQVNGLGN